LEVAKKEKAKLELSREAFLFLKKRKGKAK